MIKTMDNGFYLFNDKRKLKDVLSFLQKGFSWNSEKINNIFNRLNSQSDKIPFAAVLVNNSQIVIAILLFHQGLSFIEKKEIINLSSWYAEKSHRGMHVIKFAKKLINELEEKIITNYTPNESVYKILKALKFKDMAVEKFSIGFSKKFPFLNLFPFWKIIKFNGINIFPLKNFSKVKPSNLKDKCFYTVNSIKKYRLNLSIMNLYLSKNDYKIDIIELLNLMIKHKTIKVNIFSRGWTINNLWLIKNNNSEDFILPSKSELEVI